MATMPFGKHKGQQLSSLPDEYLHWLTTIELKPWLLAAVQDELRFRREAPPPKQVPAAVIPTEHRQAVKEMVEAGFKQLALKHHPDKGGDAELMRALLEARLWTREVCR
jgi:hypothetical protein